MHINADCPTKVQERVRREVLKAKGVFDDGQYGMPRAAKGKPVDIKMKPDAKPRRCPEPVWGHGAKRRILTEWATEKLRTGEFVHCPKGGWASRTHIALKTKARLSEGR